ncbi:MAG: FGGY family carbohydrate kinase [Asticcacaulis sp.]
MPKSAQAKCVVFDVGKSFTKASVVSVDGTVWAERKIRTPHLSTPLYRAFDVDAIYVWFISQLRAFGQSYAIDRIIPVTHGATCAFLDEHEQLIQPIQDYESAVPTPYAQAYGQIRPDFYETQSPHLPYGLNLGSQIYWHARRDPGQFSRVRWILNYPQYWAWRLSGGLCNEVTSMGCHTDLWSPLKGCFSSLANDFFWADRFPKMQSAWETAGTLRSDIAKLVELPPSVRVCVGLHDSNAALASVLMQADPSQTAHASGKAPALLSTGTWYIAMSPGAAVTPLESNRDCLANVDVFGNPVPCARFMGGRVHTQFNRGFAGGLSGESVSEAALRTILQGSALAMPSFTDTGGPFPTLRGEIRGLSGATPELKSALGMVYLALMSSTCLDLVRAEDALLIEGPLAKHAHLCGLIAALRPGPVLVNAASNGVTQGAAALAFYGESRPEPLTRNVVKPLLQKEIRQYESLWRSVVDAELAA